MILKMKVKPNAHENKLVKVDHPDYDFKAYIKATPEKEKANKDLCKFLAKEFGVAKSEVSILKGQTTNIKLIKIEDGNPI